MVEAVIARSSVRSSAASHSAGGRCASSTLPIDVANAGKRVPTLMLTDMIRRVGTRAT